ncbi:alpha/beta fold hydrolase [Saxibacter everestensis]|uniref:Alpha/beta fold hydrolase n=1 Tax=Saxibacter everestensis TaxID=2909229 RepID=A0ABY8QWZ3_9MICO|nr:alpha/beta fold hydrolase [Brevibacteriaceae bacterium ZFBP1038]
MVTTPGTEEYFYDAKGSKAIGVLLIHGFTGSPFSLRPVADALVDSDITVRVPLLPGHGTSWQEMNRSTWHQWLETVKTSYAELSASCDKVIALGISMGGGLALRMAIEHADIAGVILINPAVMIKDPLLPLLPALRRVLPSVAAIGDDIKKPGVTEHAYPRTPLKAVHSMLELYRDTRQNLDKVTQPVLLFNSTIDHVVPRESTEIIWKKISSHDKEKVMLRNSYHVATLDHDAPEIIQRSLKFVERLSR